VPLRIVLDTNVLISAIAWHGPAARLLGASDGAYQLVVSAALLDELRRKLNEPKLRDPLTKVGLTPDAAVAFIPAIAIHVEPLPVTAPALRDPSDLHVLALRPGRTSS
jgi:putative PIN family toxin of toxin-antitoxin system